MYNNSSFRGDSTALVQSPYFGTFNGISASSISSYKNTVRLATTSNLTATYNNGINGVNATLTNSGTQAAFTADNVSTNVGDPILVWLQTNEYQNGIYIVTTVGNNTTNWVLTRISNYNSISTINFGDIVAVAQGQYFTQKFFMQTTTGTITVGTTSIVFNPNPNYNLISVSGTSKTFSYIDINTIQACSNSSSTTLTVPTSGSLLYPWIIGQQILIIQTGSGQVNVVGASGVTINGGSSAIYLLYQYGYGILTYLGSDTWSLTGSIKNTKPAFLAYLSTNQTGVTGDDITYTIPFNVTSTSPGYDLGNNFNTSGNYFLAPVTDIYQFNFAITIYNLTTSFTGGLCTLNVSPGFNNPDNYLLEENNIGALRATALPVAGFYVYKGATSILVPANSEVTVSIQIQGGSSNSVNVAGGTGGTFGYTWFSGYSIH